MKRIDQIEKIETTMAMSNGRKAVSRNKNKRTCGLQIVIANSVVREIKSPQSTENNRFKVGSIVFR